MKYDGEWHSDNKNGRGTIWYTNGDKYVGDFRDG